MTITEPIVLRLDDPTYVYIEGLDADQIVLLKKKYEYKNTSKEFAYNKFRNTPRSRFIPGYDHICEYLKSKIVDTLVEVLKDGRVRMYSGYLEELKKVCVNHVVQINFSYPPTDATHFVWAKKPFDLRPYQTESVEALMNSRSDLVAPRSISLATALGKSRILAELVKRHGLRTIVMVPSANIAQQLVVNFREWFGKNKVGLLGDGSRQVDRQITIGIAASLNNIVEGTEEWTHLSQAGLFLVDESHTIAATTFENVATNLLNAVPYRYFVSGTQTRGDGTESVLAGLIGPIVYTMDVREGVRQGWLPVPRFRMISVDAHKTLSSKDPDTITRELFYNNPLVLQRAADLANEAVSKHQHQVLILIEEIDQFVKLLPLLKHSVLFAHGTLTKQHLKSVPKEYASDDTGKIVQAFNDGVAPILIGTSAVGMGTDILPVKTLIYLRGGKSFISLSQGIGRALRKPPGKEFFYVFDFDVPHNFILHRHALERVDIYNSIYDGIRFLSK